MREASRLIDFSGEDLSTTEVNPGIRTLDVNVVGTTAGGDASAANQVIGNASLSSIDSKLTTLNNYNSRTKVALLRNVYTSINVTTAAYVELLASSSDIINKLYIFDSSGRTLVLAVGAAASEVDQIYIPPGGVNIDLTIPSGSRISIKAVSGNATGGEINISCLK